MTTDPCTRCGRSDGSHVGYHEDDELPVKRGQRVRIKAGAEIWTTLPDPAKRRFKLTRSRVVTVFSMDSGRTVSPYLYGHMQGHGNELQHLEDPGICWTGTGGYWHHAKLSDVEAV